MSTLAKADVMTLSVPERIQLVADIWDSIAEAPEAVPLTDAQKATIEEIKKEFGPKLKAAQEKQDSILTEDQKNARAEVFQKAREPNEGRQSMRETIEKALNLTEAQKKDMEAARKVSEELNKALMDKVTSLLTPEQKEKLEKARQERGQRGDRGGNRKQ